MRPRLLDLFCGAGGAAMGYHRAGFDVVGVDIDPQPAYPFEFIQADWREALAFLPGLWEREGVEYAVHASPPCQAYTWGTRKGRELKWPRAIGEVREELEALTDDAVRVPWVIENVEQARPDMRKPIRLCGTMFPPRDGRQVLRHRLFESSVELVAPPHPHHVARGVPLGRYVTVAGHGGDNKAGNFRLDVWRSVMDMDWPGLAQHDLAEAIPPYYTELVGRQLLEPWAATLWGGAA